MRRRVAGTILLAMMSILTACSGKQSEQSINLKKYVNDPMTLTIWHYYAGANQKAFQELISEFNSTVGKENGIHIEEVGKGSVFDLNESLDDSINKAVGAEELPDMFMAYADMAYTVQEKTELANIADYVSEEELSEYVPEYVQEGYINQDDKLVLFPIAKSTEVTLINKTDWAGFAEETGTEISDLATWEGIVDVSEKYYNWTDAQTPDIPDDGKSFCGRDSLSNYMIIGMKQLGHDLFRVEDGNVVVDLDKESVRKLWDTYYVPNMKGYFGAYGKFRSDDVKSGYLLAYTGSTASSMYFPDKVLETDNSHAIDYAVVKAPVFEGKDDINVQQGAGMAVVKTEEDREYAATLFLKWFTQKENNIKFASESGYLPVKKEANSKDTLDQVMKEEKLQVANKTYDCLTTVFENFKDTIFYTPPVFENGTNTRYFLDDAFAEKVKQDKAGLEKLMASGMSKEEALKQYLTDENFDAWYEEFCANIKELVGAK